MNNGRNMLWYKEPAHSWNEALPLGNGRLGAMVHGGASHEKIGLNEDTLWTGYPTFNDQPDAFSAMEEGRKLAMAGDLNAAQRVMEDRFTSLWSQLYLPLGDLHLQMAHDETITQYRRELRLDAGLHSVQYTCSGVCYTREVFVSQPDQVMVVRLTANQPAAISFRASFDSQLRVGIRAEGNRLSMQGNAPVMRWEYGRMHDAECMGYGETDAEKGMAFYAAVHAFADGGCICADENGLAVQNADSATLLFNCRTSFNGWNRHPVLEGLDPVGRCEEEIRLASLQAYDKLKARHTADHTALYNRVDFELNGTGDEALLPTDERLYRHENGGEDLALYALYFHFGRYLTIASSRPGTQASNLQGIWNDKLVPPWNSNYTININTQMNYWPTLMADLPECTEPLMNLISELAESGRRTAQSYYHAPGYVAHHNTDLWRMSTPVGSHRVDCGRYALWQMSTGWLIRHVWERYEYTRDAEWLRTFAWPLIRDAAAFYLSQLTADAQGRLILPASTSPENPFWRDGKECAVARESAMTQAILEDVLDITIQAAAVIGLNDSFLHSVQQAYEKLGRPGVAPNGTLLEWEDAYDEVDIHHRHISHLYGLHPGRSITLEKTPHLAMACQKSLERRGDESTGWAMGWRINQWARLRDGDHALHLLDNQLRSVDGRNSELPKNLRVCTGGTYLNLLDSHPPFQIDGNFGACAGIMEMLLQSNEDGSPLILPALPGSWKKGSVRGLRTRRATHVDITWDGDQIEWREY